MFAWDIFRFEKLLLSNAQFNDSSLVYKFENERILTGNAQITFNLSTWTEFLKCPKADIIVTKSYGIWSFRIKWMLTDFEWRG